MLDDGQPTPTASDCCPPARDPRIAACFDDLTQKRTAGGVLPPMQPTTRRLFALLSDVGDKRPTVLELGCGSGALLVALLERGATTADGVDLSPASLDAAMRRSAEAGVADRAHFSLGDGARVDLSPRDWVIMDRVLCCYPDVDALLANAVPAASHRFAFSVPTSRGVRGALNRLVWGIESRVTGFIRGTCPGYVHSLDRIEGVLASAGFTRLRSRTGLMWYVAVWERPA